VNQNQLKELDDLSKKLEQAIKAELQSALIRGMNEGSAKEPLEKSLSGLPQQIAQSLSPVFNIIGAIAGPRITAARRQQMIDQINAQEKQGPTKEG